MTLPRLYPILDTATLSVRGFPAETAAEALLDAGAAILQLRHKGHFSRALFAHAERIADRCRQAGALFIVDDRADIAALLDAGLHVGQEDLAPSDARKVLGPDRVLGFSTHNAAQLQAAASEPADYLAIGPIFGTSSKEKPDPTLGVEGLRHLRPLAAKPLVAIGGITRANAPAVLGAGADSVAVIADLLPGTCTFESLRNQVCEWLQLVKK